MLLNITTYNLVSFYHQIKKALAPAFEKTWPRTSIITLSHYHIS
jgi:hypothetical protein